MKKMKLTAGLICLVILISIAPISIADSKEVSSSNTRANSNEIKVNSNEIKVKNLNVNLIFDGKTIQPPSGQFIFTYENTTYLPLRFVSNTLKKSVAWDNEKLTVSVVEPSSSELVSINEYLMNLTRTENSSLTTKIFVLNKLKVNYVFYGVGKTLPVNQSTFNLNGTVYVPLRFLSESIGNSITWDAKTNTINSVSIAQQGQTNENPSTDPGKSSTNTGSTVPEPTTNTGGAGSAKLSYASITSETESKLNALKSQSQASLMNTAFEYLAAKDDATKANIKAKGLQQLASFTADFNSIIANAVQKLSANGYSTDIINQYRSAFEAELQAGKSLAEGMAN